ncbi:hypothetical protein Q7P37_002933 [Cladosporium fusiforme]
MESHARAADDSRLSLWLTPPENSKIRAALTEAIAYEVSSALGTSQQHSQFEPHLTLASQIPLQTAGPDPQKWLDEIELPPVSEVEVQFKELATGGAFFKRLFIRCRRSESLLQLAIVCQNFSSEYASRAQYDPHVSLLYSQEPVSEDAKRSLEHKLAEKDIIVKGDTSSSWRGGTIWLVPTGKDVTDWHPVARRSLA